ncbi:MAG: IS30 family transposase [Chitinophagaceae bacterium]|nr:MAG: IS30 family transposase [Chitinophagaceae bacterium]
MVYHQLTREERYFISTRMRSGESLRAIAREMGRSASTLSREVARNATRYDGAYRPSKAQEYAQGRRRRCRRRSRYTREHWAWIDTLLWMKWSPEQIARKLALQGEVNISAETIYRRIRRDRSRGGHLWLYTRIMSKFARKRYRGKSTRGILAGKRHISERPKEVESRKRLGHWEGDTVMGSDKRHCMLTLVERKSGYAIVKKLSTRSMLEATQAALMALAEHGKRIKTITFDNGTEFHDYATLEQIHPVKCYFATPYHSWERGSNESFNGLLRQYFPKGTCMSTVTQADCDEVARKLKWLEN